MRTLQLVTVLVGTSWVASVAWGNGDDADERAEAKAALAKAKISLTRAIEIAVEKVPGGKAVEAELELEDGKPSYEVELLAGDKLLEVEIDAVTGKVLEVEDEDDQDGATRWDFDQDPVGKVPTGWRIGQTNPSQALATWQTVADPTAPSRGHVLALTQTRNYGHTFNLAIAEKTSYKNLDLTVRAKAVRGEEDQGGGPIWRCKDEKNYYVCRYNPLESNYRVYYVKNGRRKQLKSIKVATVPGKWYTVRITMVGNRITCYLDGKKMLEATDDTFKAAGMIGLWTKSDAVTSFDDLVVKRITAER